MVKKNIQHLESEVKRLIKVNNDNFVEHQKIENELIGKVKETENEIAKLKNASEQCTCFKYSKSMDEVIRYGQKHKEAVIELKNISETQKEKISILREEKVSLLDQVETLEFEVETDKVIIGRHKDKIENLETEIQELQNMVDKKDLDCTEHTNEKEIVLKEKGIWKDKYEKNLMEYQLVKEASTNKIECLEQKLEISKCEVIALKEDLAYHAEKTNDETKELESNDPDFFAYMGTKQQDLQDELTTKDEEILRLKGLVDKNSLDKDLKSSSSSLQEELEYANMKALVDEQGIQIKQFERNGNARNVWLNKMTEMSVVTGKELEILKTKIQKLETKQRSIPRCFYGIECRKIFCKFDHGHVFRKDNRKEILNARSPPSFHESSEFLCDHCGEVCESWNEFSIHLKRKHTGPVDSTTVFNCIICDKRFDRKKALKMHVQKCEREITCTVCDEVFVSEEELDVHGRSVHTKGDRTQCELGDTVLKRKNILRGHIRAKHETVNHKEEETLDKDFHSVNSENSENSENSDSSSTSFEDISETEVSETESGGSSS